VLRVLATEGASGMDRKQVGLWATLLFSAAAVVGVLLQVFFIGAYIFGESDALDIHKGLGMLVHLFYVLTFVAALVAAWPAWRRTGWPFALAVLGSVQAFLAGGGDDVSAWVHAFHAALVPIVFVIALRIAMRAKDTLGLGKTSSPA
jgi:uncharacterized membrane protein YhaH (DUF805 family)